MRSIHSLCLWLTIGLGMGVAPVTARSEDHPTQVLQATAKIWHSASTATAFFLIPKTGVDPAARECLLVTAAHFLEPSPEPQIGLLLRSPQPDGSYQRRELSIPIQRDNRPLWHRHPTQDIAVLRVTLPAGVELTPLPISVLATTETLRERRVRVGARLLSFGYPARVEANSAGFPIARHGTLATFPLSPPTAFPVCMIDMAAHGGDSGGPVLLETPTSLEADPGPPVLIAMVTGKMQQDEKMTMLYEERTLHHPLDLSLAIQAHFVRETIEQWEQKTQREPQREPRRDSRREPRR